MKRAVFLDRDGVITREPPHYAHKLSQLQLLPGAAEAIRRLKENGFIIVIVSNQSGIGRGYYEEADMISFNQAMQDSLAEMGAGFDALYFCPHHPEAGQGEFLKDCECRKPKPGMLTRAAKELDIDLEWSYLVGDKVTDIEAGKRAGCATILVLTGYGAEELKNHDVEWGHVANDLAGAADYIINRASRAAIVKETDNRGF